MGKREEEKIVLSISYYIRLGIKDLVNREKKDNFSLKKADDGAIIQIKSARHLTNEIVTKC